MYPLRLMFWNVKGTVFGTWREHRYQTIEDLQTTWIKEGSRNSETTVGRIGLEEVVSDRTVRLSDASVDDNAGFCSSVLK
jgi:hypothetical protein